MIFEISLLIMAAINFFLSMMEIPTWLTAGIYWGLIVLYWIHRMDEEDEND